MEPDRALDIGTWNIIGESQCDKMNPTFSKPGIVIPSSKVSGMDLEQTESCCPESFMELSPDDKPEAAVGTVTLFDVPIVCLYIENRERLCLAQISNTLLRDFSYNEIHNRRVALGITCLQCTPVQLEVLRRTGAMPVSSRRCGLITKREAERLVRSFLEEIPPPKLPENFSFKVSHKCGWGCQGLFIPSKYNSSRAKCIRCSYCNSFFSPNKFIFHHHKTHSSTYKHPDAANFNSWRRHLHLIEQNPSEALQHTWEDVKAMFNGGCRKRMTPSSSTKPDAPSLILNKSSNSVIGGKMIQSSVNPINRYMEPSLLDQEYTEKIHAHPAFPSHHHPGTVGPYGDILRSLSMHYSPWWKSAYFQNHHYSPYSNTMPLSFGMPTLNYGHVVKQPAKAQQYKESNMAVDSIMMSSQQSFPSLDEIYESAMKPNDSNCEQNAFTSTSANSQSNISQDQHYDTIQENKACSDIDELIDIDSPIIADSTESSIDVDIEGEEGSLFTKPNPSDCLTSIESSRERERKTDKNNDKITDDFGRTDKKQNKEEMRAMLQKAKSLRLKAAENK